MATIRPGTQSALLVVDVQVGVVAEAGDVSQQIDHIALAVRKARDAGVPVIWVQHDEEELPKGSAEWQWVPALVPQPEDVRVYKNFNSSFEKTTLESELAVRGVSHIVLCGAVTSWCIRATAYGALERGYDLSLIGDAHIAKTMPMGNGEAVEAKDIVREFNVVMQWVAYPGRKNRVVTAEELAF
ncbi:isochorismatase family protein [Hydrogenophaga sp. RWCD_12]|uniref:isochorismatase family protein n=1 Tax=Hydrogenophaga sp. RWCD_12 TaxID=3391190 RepID=UPI003984B4DD